MFGFRHLMHRKQAGDGRRRSPEDRDHEHRQSSGFAHTHSLQPSGDLRSYLMK